jgi:hypothetical protein
MIEHLTVLEALDKHPNDTEHAFHLNQDTDCIYFKTTQEEPINSSLPNGLKCSFNCIKLFKNTGQVLTTKIYLKHQDEISKISMAQMKLEFQAGLDKLKTLKPNLMVNKSLNLYLVMGFNVN